MTFTNGDGHDQRAAPLVISVLTRLVLGGPTRPVISFVERLGAHGWRSILATGREGEHEVAYDGLASGTDARRVEVPSLVRQPSPARDVAALLALARLIRAERPAVIHTHTAKAGAIGRVAARLAGSRARLVHTFHGHSLDRAVSGRAAVLWRAVERFLARRTDVIVALSPGQRLDLARRLGPRAERRLAVVPLAFDRRAGEAAGASDAALVRGTDGSRDRVIAFCGRGVPVKRLDLLAAATRRLGAQDPRAARRLRVVVIGPLEPGVRAAVERELAPPVEWFFAGPVPYPLPLVSAADALVLPSLSEGTPVAVLEAFAAGVPVIASAVGAVPELLGADWIRIGPGRWSTRPAAARGLLVPPEEQAEGWAGVLARFVDDPGCVPGSAEERRRFVDRTFDPDARTAELLELYARDA